ncbi:MAG: hypothetical protein ACYC9O_12930 [Candidatus Latescibacterota bacterium]
MTYKDIAAPNGWHPAIGDPYAVAWIITGAYIVVAILCFRAAAIRKCDSPGDQRVHRLFWMGAGIILLLLGINKQLDLQVWFMQLGRAISIEQGWYGRRRVAQAFFSVALLVGGIAALASVLLLLKGRWSRFRAPLLGLALLGAFVILRASAFSHVHYIPGSWMTVGPVRIRWVIELGGILVVGTGAARALRRHES